MLGDALGELEYLQTNQEIGIRAVQLLQRKANVKHKDAERQLAQLGSSNTQARYLNSSDQLPEHGLNLNGTDQTSGHDAASDLQFGLLAKLCTA